MKPNEHLKTDDMPKTVGRDSFDTFIKITDKLASFATDDLTLAALNNRYKVYSVRIDASRRPELVAEVSKYKSMKGLEYWLDTMCPANVDPKLYFSLYAKPEGWVFDYGLAVGQHIYVVGMFTATVIVLETLPKSKLLREFRDEFLSIDIRTHALFDTIRKDLTKFEPGQCRRMLPQVTGDELLMQCKDLGNWEGQGNNRVWADGEADRYLQIFREWVAKTPWSKAVKLILRPGRNGWTNFIIKAKTY